MFLNVLCLPWQNSSAMGIPKYIAPFRLGKNRGKEADMESMTKGVGIRESCMKINMEEVSLQRKTRNAYLTSSNTAYSTPPHEIQYKCRAHKRPHVSWLDALGLFLQVLNPLPFSGVLLPFLKASLFCSMPHLKGRTLLHLLPSDFTQSPGDFT